MKKRRFFSAAVAALAAASMLSAFSMSALAVGSNYSETLATDSDNDTEIKKSLVIENNANIPAASFTFTASAPESDIAATADTLAVLKGINPNKIKFGNETTGNGVIAYTAQSKKGSNGQNTTEDNVTIVDGTDDDNKSDTNDNGIDYGSYAAVKSITLDFSDCGFTEPGIYRYIITESTTQDSANQGITNDANDTRTIDVYVEDATTTTEGTTTKQLKIAGYVMYVGTQTAGPSNSQTETQGTAFNVEDGTQKTPNGVEVASATKSVGFKNTYSTHDLTFNKTVEGNQGSKDKYFKFTVVIDNLTEGTVLDV